MDPKVTADDVAKALREFMRLHHQFKSDHGVKNYLSNIHEACNSMTDKHGRLCRQVKHAERNDPKEDFPESIAEDVAGYLNYGLMVLQNYNVDLADGMKKELEKAAVQHKA